MTFCCCGTPLLIQTKLCYLIGTVVARAFNPVTLYLVLAPYLYLYLNSPMERVKTLGLSEGNGDYDYLSAGKRSVTK